MKYKVKFLHKESITTIKEVEIETDKPIHGVNSSAYRRSLNKAFANIPTSKILTARTVGEPETNTERMVLSAEKIVK